MINIQPSFRATCLVALCAAILAGCASGPKTYEIRGEADPVVNRDVSGAPLSVVVRVYQLKDAQEFSKLTFDTLAGGRPEAELLGAELLEKNEVVLVPGNKHTSTDKLREDTRYVGVVAFFRKPDPHYWRYLIDADKVRSDGLSFRAADCYLSLLNVKPAAIPGQPQDASPNCAVAQAAPVAAAAKTETAPPEATKQQSPAPAKKRKTSLRKPKANIEAAPATVNVRVPASVMAPSAPALPVR